MKKFDDIETNYNRHIKAARLFAKGASGYDRALKIRDYFESVNHPHPTYTFNYVRLSGEASSDKQFAIQLMKEMAYLVATNEHLGFN